MLYRFKQWMATSGLLMVFAGLIAGCGGNSPSTANNQTAAPTFSPGGGTYTTSKTVTISSATSGAVLYCTTDGTTPTTSSPQCAEPTTVYKTEFLQAIAVAPGMKASSVASAGYVITLQSVDTPTFNPTGGTYTGAQQVTISDSLSGANIYYTLDGTTPTTSSQLYSGAITISQSTTLNAFATASGYSDSGVTSAAYTIQSVLPVPAITSLSPSSAVAGGGAFMLTVNGANFTPGASVLWNGVSLTTTYLSAAQLTAAVPASLIASAGSANVTVVTASGASSASTFTINSAAPVISNISPASGVVGSSVTISGTNFGTSQGASTVTFNGAPATSITSWSSTSITATVPTGATTGNVVVTVNGMASAGHSFTVLPTPTITNLSPASGAVGSSVIISGTNFGASQGTSTVTFNGVAASVSSWSSTSITAIVPTGTATGNVVVTVNGVASSGVQFNVLGTPAITSLSSTSGLVGSSVTISGTNFGASQGTSTVTFNGTPATSITSWSSTSITAVVPTGATTGNVVVTVNGLASNGEAFTVQPSGPQIGGRVVSGTGTALVPISASVQLYSAGSTGYGQGATAIDSAVSTDPTTGAFSGISYDCSTLTAPNDQLYLVATGTNSGVVLMAALGTCGSLNTSGVTVTINEVTTIASAYALSGFASMNSSGGINIGAPGVITSKATTCNATNNWASSGPNTCNYLGLVNAFNTANNIVNVAQGAVWAAPSSAAWHTSSAGMTPAYANSKAPVQYLNDSTIPTARVNALADMLATCVQNLGSGCSGLFSAAATTGTGGVTPADTLQAALNIALNPGNNVTTLLGLVPTSNPPYATATLDLSNDGNGPTDLTLALTFTGAGLGLPPGTSGTATVNGTSYTSGPVTETVMAVDGSGNLWVAGFDAANYGTSNLTQANVPVLAGFSGLGAPLTPATTFDATTSTITLGGINPIQATAGAGLSAIAIDQTGNLWVGSANPGGGGDIFEISNPSSSPSIPLQFSASGRVYNLAIDTAGDLWVGDSDLISEYSNTGTAFNLSQESPGPNGITYLLFDSNLNLWVETSRDASPIGNNSRNVDQISTSDGSVLFAAFPSAGAAGATLVADNSGNVYGCSDSSKHLDQFQAGVWVNNGNAPAIASGTGAGRACGNLLLMDGLGRLFAISNATAQAIDEFTTAGTLISPALTGYTGTSSTEPVALNRWSPLSAYGSAAIDGSGNLWVLNQSTQGENSVSGNVLVEFVGIGAPVVTPQSAALTNGALGARP